MANNLFFLPILSDALRQSDAGQALCEAFARIEQMGRQPEYETGLRQFRRFMEIVARESAKAPVDLDRQAKELVPRLTIELAADCFEGDEEERRMALELIRSRVQWTQEYERLRAEIGEEPPPEEAIGFLIERDGLEIGQIRLSNENPVASVGGIIPGSYRVLLETGQTLWEGVLSEEQIQWRAAFGERPQELAAKTEAAPRRPRPEATVEASLPGGDVALRVLPDLESGWLELELAPNAEASK